MIETNGPCVKKIRPSAIVMILACSFLSQSACGFPNWVSEQDLERPKTCEEDIERCENDTGEKCKKEKKECDIKPSYRPPPVKGL